METGITSTSLCLSRQRYDRSQHLVFRALILPSTTSLFIMASVHTPWGNLPSTTSHFSGQISPPYSPSRSNSIVIPPFWDGSTSLEQNVRRMAEENRLQILESRQQMAEMRSMLSGILRSITAVQGHIDELEETVRKADLKEQAKLSNITREEIVTSRFSMTWTPPKRPISIANCNAPLSPAPTDLNEPLCENADLELNWNNPAWLGEDTIDHPYRSRLPSFASASHADEADGTRDLLHILPTDHKPEELVHSPFGRIDDESELTAEQQQLLAIRRIDTEERTMGFLSEQCDHYPILLGGLYEPIIQGRFPDESDVRQASVFRVQRWGINPGLLLYRLPRRELLLPNDPLDLPDDALKKRHKTWYFTYRVWYRFVNSVGPALFPGLLDQSWVSILESPPEEARTKFSEVLCQYMGYAGTSTLGGDSGITELTSIIPDLLLEFDQAVQSPWPCQKPLTDLIIDLDEFESHRALEIRDSTRLWRGVLSNVFPKHCMKHIRVGSVGGFDSRWAVVHREFSERLKRRQELWETMGKYRFARGSYLPDATGSRAFDREQRIRQLIHESEIFASILLCWKDGALYLKQTVIPHLAVLSEKVEPLDDSQLKRWAELCRRLQHFYDWKCGFDIS